MRVSVHVIALAAALGAFASVTQATTGGPEIADALGWDPVDRKVFFTIHLVDESGRMARVVYFTRGGSPFGYVVDWSRADLGDSAYARRLRSLRKRLRPLRLLAAPTIPESRSIVGVDTVGPPDMRWPRFRVRARDLQSFGGTLEVTTIGDPDVRVIRQYFAPDWPTRLGIVSFRGIPYEAGYETQVPVLLPGPRDTLRIEWRRLP